jgi:hypothetical protein
MEEQEKEYGREIKEEAEQSRAKPRKLVFI